MKSWRPNDLVKVWPSTAGADALCPSSSDDVDRGLDREPAGGSYFSQMQKADATWIGSHMIARIRVSFSTFC